jgi:amphi-Trp domain-containing protein
MAEFAWEKAGTRAEVAALLRRAAEGLEGGGKLELEHNGARLALDVPNAVALEVEVEIDAESGETEVEIELKWSSRRAAKPTARPKRARSS